MINKLEYVQRKINDGQTAATCTQLGSLSMADLLITGRVDDTSSAGVDVEFETDISYSVVLGDLGGHGVRSSGIVRTESRGRFSVSVTMPDDQVSALTAPAVLLVHLSAFLPITVPTVLDVNESLTGASADPNLPVGERIFQEANSRLRNLNLSADMSMVMEVKTRVVPQEGMLAGVDSFAVEVLRASESNATAAGNRVIRSVLASVTARREPAGHYLMSLLLPTAQFTGEAVWLRLRMGQPIEPQPLARIPVGGVIARTRVQPTGVLTSGAILLRGFNERLGLGDVSAAVPRNGSSQGFTFRDVHVTFGNGDLTVSGRVGKEAPWQSNFQLYQIGRFEARYSLSYRMRDEAPFDPGELTDLVQFTTASRSFDLLPDTDVDEALGLLGDAEAWAASHADEIIRDRIAGEIRENIRRRVDEQMNNLRNQLQSISSDPDELAEEMRETFFIQPGAIVITVNDISFTGTTGVWHPVLDLLTIPSTGSSGSGGGCMVTLVLAIPYVLIFIAALHAAVTSAFANAF